MPCVWGSSCVSRPFSVVRGGYNTCRSKISRRYSNFRVLIGVQTFHSVNYLLTARNMKFVEPLECLVGRLISTQTHVVRIHVGEYYLGWENLASHPYIRHNKNVRGYRVLGFFLGAKRRWGFVFLWMSFKKSPRVCVFLRGDPHVPKLDMKNNMSVEQFRERSPFLQVICYAHFDVKNIFWAHISFVWVEKPLPYSDKRNVGPKDVLYIEMDIANDL